MRRDQRLRLWFGRGNRRFRCCKTRETENSTSTRNCLFMLYPESSVVIGFTKARERGKLTVHTHTSECASKIVTNDSLLQLCFFFFYVSIRSWLTVASRLPWVLYASTIMSLFEEALSVFWTGQIHTVWSFAVLSVTWVGVMFSLLELGDCQLILCWWVLTLVAFFKKNVKSNLLSRVPSKPIASA